MIRLAVRCRPQQAEAVLAELIALAPNGVEEDHGPEWVEYAIYGAAGELPDLGSVEASAGAGSVEVTSSEIPDDWADRWRDFHQPTMIGGRVLIRPPWSPARAAEHDVVIEPGQAFGTGAHATTRMCVELLLSLADAGEATGSLTDLGTGSGVLAIAAARLGWAPVTACDHERAALEAASANASANGVALDLRRIDLRREPPPHAETIVANLTAPLLIEVAARLDQPPRRMICSGVLAGESGGVAAAFAAAGMQQRESREAGDWEAFSLISHPSARRR